MTADGWERVTPIDKIDPDVPFGTYIDGSDIAVYLVDGEVYATARVCSHAYALLADGHVEDGQVHCSLHQGSFDIKSGDAKSPPCTDALQTYPVKGDGGVVFVRI